MKALRTYLVAAILLLAHVATADSGREAELGKGEASIEVSPAGERDAVEAEIPDGNEEPESSPGSPDIATPLDDGALNPEGREPDPNVFIYGTGTNETNEAAPSNTWLERGFSLFGYLLMIGALAVASLWFFRNHSRFRGDQKNPSRSLRVAETRPLGQKQFLAIVECDGRRVLLGLSPGRMDFLCGLSSDPERSVDSGSSRAGGSETTFRIQEE